MLGSCFVAFPTVRLEAGEKKTCTTDAQNCWLCHKGTDAKVCATRKSNEDLWVKLRIRVGCAADVRWPVVSTASLSQSSSPL